jgi:predicted DNA-binding protein (MmcQ/YjbR family)
MTDIELLFNNRKADTDKLLAFGFEKNKEGYIYSVELLDGQFETRIVVGKNGKLRADVVETMTNEIYLPVKISGATGAFIGKVRAEYEKLLSAISEQCFFRDSFKSAGAKSVIRYVKNNYQDELEFLWPQFPKNAIYRRKDNAKWYAALLNLPRYKVGLSGEEDIDIIDLRIDPSTIDAVIDGKKYFPGYHMNKRHWVTICLDGSVPIKEIYHRIDASYALAKKV